MKYVNKRVIILLILTLILSFNTIYAMPFPDIPENAWYKDYVDFLSPKSIVQGNDKGEFMPSNKVRYNEYLKMVVVALENKTYTASEGEDWDKPYIDKAYELGLITNKTKDYNTPIDRYEMAKIIVKACKEEYGDYNKYKSSISDFNTIPSEYQEYVLKAFSKGFITGKDSKGTFDGSATMQRCESVAVIARLLDKDMRILPGEPVKEEPGKKEEPTPRPKLEVIYGGYNDLIEVPLISEADIAIYGPKSEQNHLDEDFSVLLRVDPNTPLEPQYTDVENLFRKRFGEDDKTVTEIMNYIKKKKHKDYDLPYRDWKFKGQTVKVWSPGGDYSIEIRVWRRLLS